MPPADARALAHLLAQFDDTELSQLLARRAVPAGVAWGDLFDAADALLDPASIQRGLEQLTAAEVAALEESADGLPLPASDARTALRTAGMLDADGAPLRAVTDAVAATPRTAGTPLPTGTAESDAQLAERAFVSAAALADILESTATTPLARIGSGALGAADRRRLVERTGAPDAAAVDELLAIAEVTGLITAAERRWLVSPLGERWLDSGTVARWHAVARELRDRLPRGLRGSRGDAARGWTAPETWLAAYPLSPTWPQTAHAWVRRLQRWAILGADNMPAGWARGLAAGDTPGIDDDALQALLPSEVDKVYVQNDLTAIAPGPLEPRLDRRLRTMALRESRAQASSYRFTAETLGHAFGSGETAASVREFLTELSLTGLPQPLAYEIDRAAARHGAIRVGPDGSGATRVWSEDPALRDTVAVDHALRPLGLHPEADSLISNAGAETTFWMLIDARYPAVLVDVDGHPRRADRHARPASPAAPADSASRPYATLIARLRGAHSPDADTAWMGRELEQAAKSRSRLTLAVKLPDGTEREVTLEVTGMGGGRIRGRDVRADVERTLPVSSIVSVRPAEA